MGGCTSREHMRVLTCLRVHAAGLLFPARNQASVAGCLGFVQCLGAADGELGAGFVRVQHDSISLKNLACSAGSLKVGNDLCKGQTTVEADSVSAWQSLIASESCGSGQGNSNTDSTNGELLLSF